MAYLQGSPPLPPQPPARKLSTGAIVAIVVGGVLALLCGICGIGVVATRDQAAPTKSTEAQAAASVAVPGGVQTPVGDPAPPPPAPTRPPVPEDQIFEGRGDKVIKLTLPEGFVHIATITHSGRSNFAVFSLDAAGENLDLVVNEIGAYSGVRPLDVRDKPAALKVTADGSWKFVIQAAQKAPVWTGKATGKGDAVLVMEKSKGFATVKINHTGKSNFVVAAYGSSYDLLVNEIGNYSGETLLPAGTVLLEIEADGTWTIDTSS